MNKETKQTPFLSTKSRLNAARSWTRVDSFEVISEYVSLTEEVLSEFVPQLIEQEDERVEVLNQNLGRIGVRVDKDVAKEVWDRAGVLDDELRRSVSMAHNLEMKDVVQYTSGGTPTTEEFVFKTPDADSWTDPFEFQRK